MEGSAAEPWRSVGPPLASRASFTRRLGAWLIDIIIVGVASGLIATMAATVAGEAAATALQLPLTIAGWVYYVYFWHEYGATPGKMALGLRVVDDRGQYPTWGRAIGRLFAQILSALPFFLGYFWALGAQRRTWHDLLAGTYVVHQQ